MNLKCVSWTLNWSVWSITMQKGNKDTSSRLLPSPVTGLVRAKFCCSSFASAGASGEREEKELWVIVGFLRRGIELALSLGLKPSKGLTPTELPKISQNRGSLSSWEATIDSSLSFCTSRQKQLETAAMKCSLHMVLNMSAGKRWSTTCTRHLSLSVMLLCSFSLFQRLQRGEQRSSINWGTWWWFLFLSHCLNGANEAEEVRDSSSACWLWFSDLHDGLRRRTPLL